ncbi:MAG: hypothetical protein EXR62_10125 [Chloroflexi bacterium]|nr:hypothetical protein [Chloroflexota bacterium]
MALSAEQKNRFFQDGYIAVKKLISPEELASLRQHYEDLVLGHVPNFPQRHVSVRDVQGHAEYGMVSQGRTLDAAVRQGPYHDRRGTQVYPRGEEDYDAQRRAPVKDPLDAVSKVNVPSRYDPVFASVMRSPKIVDIVEDLFGSPNIKLYFDQIFAKPPFDRANRYHQDSVFWPFFASNFQVTAQVLLDDSTMENGCIRFIPGSQNFGLVNWDHLPYMLTEDVLAAEVPVPLQAGDVTFHHSLSLHCSGPNMTPNRRRGWSMHYVSAETRYIGTPEEGEHLKNLDILEGPEPMNGWPLIRGHAFPGGV